MLDRDRGNLARSRAVVSALRTTPVKGLRICARDEVMLEIVGVSDDRRFYLKAQDLLGLPSVARMNTPGRASGNWRWRWRVARGALSAGLARRLREACARAERLA
jgi:4-alpha-glucanotransferase